MAIDKTWWDALDEAWKGVFRGRFDFEGNPTAEELSAIENVTVLGASKAAITSFAPISGLPKLESLDFSGCKALSSYEGLPPSVKCLTFHWLPITDFAWLDKLPNMERVYCDKDLQRKVNLRITKNRKARK